MEIVRIYQIPDFAKAGSDSLFFGESDSLEYGINQYSNHSACSILFDEHSYDRAKILDSLEAAEVIIVNSLPFFKTFKKELAELKAKGKLVFVWDGVFWDYSENKDSFTAILTCVTNFVDKYQKLSIHAHLLTFSFDSRIHEQIPPVPYKERKDRPIFMGTINVGKSAHFNRLRLLFDLRNQIEMKVNFGPDKWKKFLFLLLTKPILGLKYGALILSAKPAVFGRDYFSELGSRKYVINNHLDIGGTAGNIRLFETTGMGALLITDYLPELENLFDLDREIKVFRDPKRLRAQLKDITSHPELVEKIAAAGFEKTSTQHSVKNRVERFLSIVSQYKDIEPKSPKQ
ncbi:MAG: hypothetical protein SchgKO_23840 [Schleiferiaceae bacterium]